MRTPTVFIVEHIVTTGGEAQTKKAQRQSYNIVFQFHDCIDLEIDFNADIETASCGEQAFVYTLKECGIACRKLGVGAQILGEGKQITGLSPYRDPLNGHTVDGQFVADGHVLQLQITAVFYPTVAEGAVAHGVVISHSGNICALTFITPAAEHRSSLVLEAAAALQLLTGIVVNIAAETVLKVCFEPQTLPR